MHVPVDLTFLYEVNNTAVFKHLVGSSIIRVLAVAFARPEQVLDFLAFLPQVRLFMSLVVQNLVKDIVLLQTTVVLENFGSMVQVEELLGQVKPLFVFDVLHRETSLLCQALVKLLVELWLVHGSCSEERPLFLGDILSASEL